MDWYLYWGKTARGAAGGLGAPYHLLPYHHLDVAAAGRALLTADPRLLDSLARAMRLPAEDAQQLTVFFLALHDIGKFASSFQALAPAALEALRGPAQPGASTLPYTTRHDTLGFLLWEQVILPRSLGSLLPWGGAGLDLEDVADMVRPLAHATFGHHGRPPRLQATDTLRAHFGDAEIRTVLDYVAVTAALLPPPPLAFESFDERRFTNASWLFAGIAVLADWIGSHAGAFRTRPVRSRSRPTGPPPSIGRT
jgi:CRISPR-associated endonuclease/helicase Cas3